MAHVQSVPLENIIAESVSLSLNRSKGRFLLAVGDENFEQTTCEFLLTFGFVQDQDIEQYLMDPDHQYDQVRIPLSGCGRFVTLSLSGFIRLRAAYLKEMFELRLEDLLQRQGVTLTR